MRKAKAVLDKLAERFMPGLGKHHNIIIDDSTGRPMFGIMLDDCHHFIVLEESDMDGTVDELVREIADAVDCMEADWKGEPRA